ncbi:TPA: hypothetical protein N0F65_001496 [Lagenidium giganteum]|uniref:Choline transporter-like protein n=1 Tax=Lagenidium giganteum TaxID=4803 RepID=A0AAV2Z1X7_9STRA|nr:TPA: hypothetical protein N0F65_001496 [Lagenidium giganteum]
MELEQTDTHALLADDRCGEGSEDTEHLIPRAYAGGGEHRDRIFALVFFGNLGVISFIAVFFGLPNASHIHFTKHRDDSGPAMSHGVRIFLVFIATSLIGAITSAAWLQVLQRYAKEVITYTLNLSIGMLLLLSGMAFFNSSTSGRAIAFINLFLAMMVIAYYARIRPAIAFAASNLAMASRLLFEFPRLVQAAYVALAAQAVWILIWSLAVIGVLAKAVDNLHDSGTFGNFCFFFMLLSLYWFVHVARNVVHCVTAGVVGEWWFGAHDENTVVRAQTRALTSSLGSICLGSLVVAVLNALETLLMSTPRRKGSRSANACLECIIRLVQRNAQYFNKFAFCQVAIYGKDFQTAGYDSLVLFRARGWTALMSDNLVSSVLSIGCLVVGVTSGVIGSAWAHVALQCSAKEAVAYPHECETFNVILLTFVACSSIGYAMCGLVSSILDSNVATIFVCFAEDPAALARSNPQEHTRLVDAWSRLKPELLMVYPTQQV